MSHCQVYLTQPSHLDKGCMVGRTIAKGDPSTSSSLDVGKDPCIMSP